MANDVMTLSQQTMKVGHSSAKKPVMTPGRREFFSYRDCLVDYYDQTYDLLKIRTVDFIMVPFADNRAIAHTMLSFGFEGGDYVGVSVEVLQDHFPVGRVPVRDECAGGKQRKRPPLPLDRVDEARALLEVIDNMIRGVGAVDHHRQARFPRGLAHEKRQLTIARETHLGEEVEIILTQRDQARPMLFDGLAERLFTVFEGAVEQGDFEALFLPSTDTFDSVDSTESRENGRFLYSFLGSPSPKSPHPINSAYAMYFVKHANQFFITSDSELAATIAKAVN